MRNSTTVKIRPNNAATMDAAFCSVKDHPLAAISVIVGLAIVLDLYHINQMLANAPENVSRLAPKEMDAPAAERDMWTARETSNNSGVALRPLAVLVSLDLGLSRSLRDSQKHCIVSRTSCPKQFPLSCTDLR